MKILQEFGLIANNNGVKAGVNLINFPNNITFPNHLDGDTFRLCRADIITNNVKARSQIVNICSQGLVYDNLFKEGLKERPYAESDAEDFLNWAHAGWQDNSHYVFLIVDETSSIQGCIDIKSCNLLQAEIGYWANVEVPGNVTNALVSLSEVSFGLGFSRLVAYVKFGNVKSVNVLLRAGFVEVADLDGREGYSSYSKIA